jgi:superfamily I DNA and/or RNA helicase
MSACFPLAQNLFELAIFDEASQIPLEHALGTLQRSQRVLIAGDPQQMSPSNYFSSVSESIDLLHQASYYMPGVFLSYHYRSRHPELIAFSNEHFYQNRLSAFQDALFLSNPIEFHYIQNALYNERVNRVEAKEVAKFISSKLTENSSLGIVAFSESQLEEIFEHLSLNAKNLLQERIDQDDIFFKSLENVQGDECEELIVSFGYGISEKEGKFNLRFGPLNQSNGHKRLNVLLTRAKRKIHFFASVKSIDFKPSSNESVDLMRKWFVKIESNPNSSISESQIVYLPEIVSKNKNILTISTLYSIYKSRNWHIKVDNYKNVTY